MTCLDKRREIKQGEKGDHILIKRPDFVADFMITDTSRKDAGSSGDFFFSFWTRVLGWRMHKEEGDKQDIWGVIKQRYLRK
jgi:hypothetical protein